MVDSPHSDSRSNRGLTGWRVLVSGLAVAGLSMVLYWLTAYRTIAWWDNAEYSLSAVTLGVAHPPGSLLLTILGWFVTKLPLGGAPVFTLNVFAGVMAAVMAGVVAVLAVSMYRNSEVRVGGVSLVGSERAAVFGAAIGALAFAFSYTVWGYATQFTPYILTGLMTALILFATVQWWRRADAAGAGMWLLLMALLVGLDFSVHRTNLLMIPGLVVAILIRKPSTLGSIRSWALGLVGLAGGLAFHLLLIPIAAARPFLNMNDPSSLTSFWDYVSLRQMGGSFLLNLFPRKAPLWGYQIMDYLKAFASNFLPVDGWMGFLGILPLLLGIVGFLILWRRNWKLGAAMTVLFLCTSVGAIVYFNIPENFFRSFDRHYLPSFVIFGSWVAYGAAAIVSAASYEGAGARPFVAGFFVLLAPVYLADHNFTAADGSDNYFAYDYGTNMLSTVPDNSIILTSGDNDTWPLLYLQAAEGVKPGVTVLNQSLLNTSWFLKQVLERDSSFPLSIPSDGVEELRIRPWKDTVLAFPGAADTAGYRLAEGYMLPDSLRIMVQPTIQGKFLMIQDQVLIDLIGTNAWKRPIYLTGYYSWLAPHLRFEGLVWQLLPVQSASLNRELLRENLLTHYVYRGYNDPTLAVDFTTGMIGANLFYAFAQLASEEVRAGDSGMCAEVMAIARRTIPPERTSLTAEVRAQIERVCNPMTDSMVDSTGTQ